VGFAVNVNLEDLVVFVAAHLTSEEAPTGNQTGEYVSRGFHEPPLSTISGHLLLGA
jgi:hypothetical protein